MKQAIVKAVGPQAISEKDQLIILFGPHATPELEKVSVIQELKLNEESINLIVGGKISFDEQVYTIKFIGDYASEQLNTIGHVTLVFKEVPTEDRLANGLYLEPLNLPEITKGTVITYH